MGEYVRMRVPYVHAGANIDFDVDTYDETGEPLIRIEIRGGRNPDTQEFNIDGPEIDLFFEAISQLKAKIDKVGLES